jgi:DNA-binding transcriptional ArsR family regulator
MRDLMAVFKALADENRVRILLALDGKELCLCQIVELLGLAHSTVSKHVTILKQARLVESRKEGRWVYCRLADDDTPREARQITQVVAELLANDPRVQSDAKRLKQILKIDPEELCRRLNQC